MTLVPSFEAFLQPLAVCMTAPSFQHFVTLVCGWTFAHRRTVTAMIQAADAVGKRHHSIFHRFFAEARWSLDRLGLTVFDLLVSARAQPVGVALTGRTGVARTDVLLKLLGLPAVVAIATEPTLPQVTMTTDPLPPGRGPRPGGRFRVVRAAAPAMPINENA